LGIFANKKFEGQGVSPLARAKTDQKLIVKAMAKSVSDFVRVASTGEIPEGKMRKVIVGNQQVLVVNVKGRYYAIGNVCTHVGGPLDQGILEGHEVQCPWHHSHFDVTSGQVKRGPATRPEPVYDVKVESGDILVGLKQ
jgi:nitrite reductase/ring-hydroxylating ferredoxin subunit